jgi:AcrR family transcriptional regulator
VEGQVPQPRLRERLKQRTRQEIAGAAFELIAERGFEQVRIAEIAERAGVSEATVYNYFPAKEDLIYTRLQSFEDGLLEAVRRRPVGQPLLEAFRSYLLAGQGMLADPNPSVRARLVTMTRIVTSSPALRARERQIYDEATGSLARLIAEQASYQPGDLEPWVIANALTGIHRALVSYVREQLLAGADPGTLTAEVPARADRALSLLRLPV